jgi:hypothetical protein
MWLGWGDKKCIQNFEGENFLEDHKGNWNVFNDELFVLAMLNLMVLLPQR